ncbi:hypothetical protein [Streptomyces rapamycinicus]|uniref:Uncharacterized protein n=2 Tax=Streptomyces rapamycinicus TaxID=1226757 RepID=A0A0A0NU67_STRRN|nr:hypothetical protein [Streptomyces rapamycinicus]AGP58330.1 hypothetical protein M271_34590 [Streptomyces rapamycinicus NRRL 5491]MBB4786022.1 hypothetical protein [Streptomyces rapamycinicus]RLV78515.1 hypothetical protein D3C57_109060 [Streptomyces rapamycinicus NRRL 5491]UTO66144.1 hypothetical protein LJB45_30040 [Streptomyces rapamycinicus]UTP34098.1 hypothetical protein LIV37_35175 [Streptomyces rapamycinicus NRRL 5491]
MDTLTTPAVESLYDDLFLNGGFTIMARTDGSAYVPTDGYAVSLTPTQHTIPATAPFDAFADLIRSVTARYGAANGLGGWLSDGVIYIDPIEIIPDQQAAILAGKEREQLAIFDLAAGAEMTL